MFQSNYANVSTCTNITINPIYSKAKLSIIDLLRRRA